MSDTTELDMSLEGFWHDTPILLNTPIDPPGLGDRISTHVEGRLGMESPFIPIDQPRMQGSSQDQHSMSEHDIVQLEHGMETLDLGTKTVTFDLRQGGARPKDRFHARQVLGAMSQAASTVAGTMGGVFSSITTLATCSRARAHDNQYSSGLNTSGRQATRPMSIPLRQGRSYGWRPEQVSRRNEREYQFPQVNLPFASLINMPDEDDDEQNQHFRMGEWLLVTPAGRSEGENSEVETPRLSDGNNLVWSGPETSAPSVFPTSRIQQEKYTRGPISRNSRRDTWGQRGTHIPELYQGHHGPLDNISTQERYRPPSCPVDSSMYGPQQDLFHTRDAAPRNMSAWGLNDDFIDRPYPVPGHQQSQGRSQNRDFSPGDLPSYRRPQTRDVSPGDLPSHRRSRTRDVSLGDLPSHRRSQTRDVSPGDLPSHRRSQTRDVSPGDLPSHRRPQTRDVSPGDLPSHRRSQTRDVSPGDLPSHRRSQTRDVSPGDLPSHRRPQTRDVSPGDLPSYRRPQTGDVSPGDLPSHRRSQTRDVSPGDLPSHRRPQTRGFIPGNAGNESSHRRSRDRDVSHENVPSSRRSQDRNFSPGNMPSSRRFHTRDFSPEDPLSHRRPQTRNFSPENMQTPRRPYFRDISPRNLQLHRRPNIREFSPGGAPTLIPPDAFMDPTYPSPGNLQPQGRLQLGHSQAIQQSSDLYNQGSIYRTGDPAYRPRSPRDYHGRDPSPGRFSTVSSQDPSRKNKKPATYDGKSSWKDYHVQFEMVASLNGWDEETKALELATSLRENAQSVLTDLDADRRTDYQALVTALTARFEPDDQADVYLAQIRTCSRKKSESLPELGQEMKRLARLALPTATTSIREWLAMTYFIEALDNELMEYSVKQAKPRTVDEAVKAAVEMEAFQWSRKRRTNVSGRDALRMQQVDLAPRDKTKKSNGNNSHVNRTKTNPNTKTGGENGGGASGNQDEKTQNNDSQTVAVSTPPSDMRKCYACDAAGHIARDCTVKCQRYGKTGHKLSSCRVSVCNYCKKLYHTEDRCFKKQSDEAKDQGNGQ